MNFFARLLRSRKRGCEQSPTTVELTFNGAADNALSRAFLEMLRQRKFRIRRDDGDEPPSVPV